MTALIAVGAILGVPAAAVAILIARAPEGFEDSEGFHLGKPGDEPSPVDRAVLVHARGDSRG